MTFRDLYYSRRSTRSFGTRGISGDEIRSLLASGIPAKCTAMQAIGYKEFVAALEGRDTLGNAAEELKKASRHYAKRQLTWFRRNKAIHWLTRQTGQGSEEILQQARQVLQPSDN